MAEILSSEQHAFFFAPEQLILFRQASSESITIHEYYG